MITSRTIFCGISLIVATLVTGCNNEEAILRNFQGWIPANVPIKVVEYDSDSSIYMVEYQESRPVNEAAQEAYEKLRRYEVEIRTSTTVAAKQKTDSSVIAIRYGFAQPNRVIFLYADLDSPTENKYFHEKVIPRFNRLNRSREKLGTDTN